MQKIAGQKWVWYKQIEQFDNHAADKREGSEGLFFQEISAAQEERSVSITTLQ
jgi:hypothetical protein